MLDGLRGVGSVAELCCRKDLVQSSYCRWSEKFREVDNERLASDTARASSKGEIKDFWQEARGLREVVAEHALEARLLKNA